MELRRGRTEKMFVIDLILGTELAARIQGAAIRSATDSANP
jgi:hypothetical protein